MDIYRDQIEKMVYEQKRILMKYTNEHNRCIEGNLAYCSNHGKKTYYHTYFKDGKYVRTSIDRNPEVIRKLARKEFLSVSGKVLDHNINALMSKSSGCMTMCLLRTSHSGGETGRCSFGSMRG